MSDLGNYDTSLTSVPAEANLTAIDEIRPLGDKPFEDGSIDLTPDELAQIWRRIDMGVAHQKDIFWPVFRDANLLWKGEHWPHDHHQHRYDGKLVINIVPNTIKSLVESVTFSEADFTIKQWGSESAKLPQIANSILRFYLSEQQADAKTHIRWATYDSKLYGVGFLQIGWLFKTEEIQLEEGRMNILPQGVTIEDVKRFEANGLLPPGSHKDWVESDDVIEDRFQVRRINPMDMILPPGVTSIVREWPWCAKISRPTISQLKVDPRFKSRRRRKGDHGKYSTDVILDVRDLKGTTKLSEPYTSYSNYLPGDLPVDDERKPPDTKFVEILDYYESDRRIHVMLCMEDRTKYLLAEKWSWKSKKYPFRTIHNTHTPDEFYGKSVPIEIWDQQIELNESRTQNMEHRRQFNRMYLYMEDSLGNKSINGLQDGKSGSLIAVKANPAGLDAVKPIQHAQLQPEVYKSYEWAIQGMELISGLSQYQFHSAPSKRTSATEAQIIDKSNGILFMTDARSVERLWKEVAEDCLDWAEQYAALVRNLAIFDKDDNPIDWIDFTGDMIRGERLVEVWAKSTQPPDAETDLQTNAQVLQILLQATQIEQQMGHMPRNVAIIFRRGLQILGERNIDELLPLPPANPTPQMLPQQGMLPPQQGMTQQTAALPLVNLQQLPGGGQ